MNALKISLGLNVALIGGIIFFELNRLTDQPIAAPVADRVTLPAPPAASSVTSDPSEMEPRSEPQPFRWQQLESKTSYRAYIANLRAAGCPESTVEDIVRGDTHRAFVWERHALALDGSGEGTWSEYREGQMIASLLGETTMPAPNPNSRAETDAGSGEGQSADNGIAKSYPLFLQNVNWSALGFSADDQAAIAQVRQQFEGRMKNLNAGNSTGQNPSSPDSNPGGTTAVSQTQTVLQDANDQLQALLGAPAYAAYEQAQYYAWFQPQALTAGAGPLIINAN